MNGEGIHPRATMQTGQLLLILRAGSRPWGLDRVLVGEARVQIRDRGESKMKVKELRKAIAELDDDVELTIRPVQSFVIEPTNNNESTDTDEGGDN